jgi:phosphatidylglycerol:prolipoprotein diacylglycerol transferase
MKPVIFSFGSIDIYAYGLMLALAFLVGTLVARTEALRRGLKVDLVYDVALGAAVGGIVGARFFYVAYYWELYAANPLRALAVWEGGLVFYGGLFGGATVVLAISYLKNYPLEDLADLVGLVLPLGIAITRIGCFLNGCCYGKPTQLPWGVVFPGLGEVARHPTQIYELLYTLIIFIFLWVFKDRLKRGHLFAYFLVFYSFCRFFNEFLRVNPSFLWGLTGSQVVSLIIFFASLTFLTYNRVFQTGERREET